MQLIKDIHDFNHKAGLVNGYDDYLESSMQVEEALENFDLTYFTKEMQKSIIIINQGKTPLTPRDISREVVSAASEGNNISAYSPIADVDRLDKACDAFVLAVGAMTKLELSPRQITRAVNVVIQANNAKLDCPLDDHGKLTKPEGFTGPEVLLQLILDERKGAVSS